MRGRGRPRRCRRTTLSPLDLAVVQLTQSSVGLCASGGQERIRSPPFDREACRNDGALEAGFDRKAFEVSQHEPDAEGITGTGLIDDGLRARGPTMEALVMRVIEDSAVCTAFEDDEAEPAVDQARQRFFRILLRAVET